MFGISCKKSKNKTKYYFLWIPVFKVKEINNRKIKIYFLGIPVVKITFNEGYIKIFLCGVKVLQFKNFFYDLYMDILEKNEDNVLAYSSELYEKNKDNSYKELY